jgi:hypothetical protein
MAGRIQDTVFDMFQSLAPDRGLSSVLGLAPTIAAAAGTEGDDGGVGSTVARIFTSGLGLAPLVSGLLGLFGGGSSEPPPLMKYTMPDRLYFQGADIADGVASADYDQFGNARSYTASTNGRAASGAAPTTSPQISVNVQTMDARSFLDHSTEIAQAVRQAMLTLSPVNDVVNDL